MNIKKSTKYIITKNYPFSNNYRYYYLTSFCEEGAGITYFIFVNKYITMNRSNDRLVETIRINNSRSKNKTYGSYYKTNTQRTLYQVKKTPFALISVLRKIFKNKLHKTFLKLSANRNEKDVQNIIARYMGITLKYKLKSIKNVTFAKIRSQAYRHKIVSNFCKLLHTLEKSKHSQWKTYGFNKIKLLFVHEKGIQGNMNKLNELLNPPTSRSLKKNQFNSSTSKLKEETQVSLGARSLSSTRLSRYQIKQEDTLKRFQNIWKQNQFYRSLEITQETKEALIKAKRIEPKLTSVQLLQNTLKPVIASELRRYEGLKMYNYSKHIDYLDGQLTFSIIHLQNRLIAEMHKQIKQTSKLKLSVQKSQIHQREERIRAEMETKKTRDFHAKNVERQMTKLMDEIYENLSERQFLKAKNRIKNFLNRFEKEDFAADRVHFYHAIDDALDNYDQIEKCLDEVCNILEILSNADLNKVDQCLRSLKANHKDFNYMKSKYKHSKKFHGKKMVNITHNLQRFNDDIIKYLEIKKEKIKESEKDQFEIDKMKVRFEAENNMLKTFLQKEKKKMALQDIQLQKFKHKIQSLTEDLNHHRIHENLEKSFEKKIGMIIDKMNRKIGNWVNEYETLKKDPNISTQKPMSIFFQFVQLIEKFSEDKLKKQIEQFSEVIGKIRNIFTKKRLKNDEKFTQICKILDFHGKRNPSLIELTKNIEILMVTITGKTREESEVIKMNELEMNLSVEKRRNRELKKQVQIYKQQSEKNSSRGSTPPKRQYPRRSVPSTQLSTIEELIPKLNQTFMKPIGSVDDKLNEAHKILDTMTKKKISSKRVNDLLAELIRNIIYQEDDSPVNQQKRKRKNSAEFKNSTFIKGIHYI